MQRFMLKLSHYLILSAAMMLPTPCAFAQSTAAPPAEAPRTGTIAGRVLGEDGQPFAHAHVYLFASDPRGTRAASRSAETDDEGRFQFDGLAPAAYQMNVFAPGFIAGFTATGGEAGTPLYRIGESVTLTLRKGGVITGRVTDAGGEPIAGVAVEVVQVRDEAGHRAPGGVRRQGNSTDDRGVYRIYGLPPGVYIVCVSGGMNFRSDRSPIEGEVMTYSPSSTRDDAAEYAVNAGEEVRGADIRHRGERGRAASGRVIVAAVPEAPASSSFNGYVEGVSVDLRQLPSGAVINSTFLTATSQQRGFGFYGLADGEYEVAAQMLMPGKDGFASEPRRFVVKGADVSGLDLTLAPLGSVTGRVVLEPRPAAQSKTEGSAKEGGACRPPRAVSVEEAMTELRRDEPPATANGRDEWQNNPLMRLSGVAPDGTFVHRSLKAGRYRIAPQLPNEDWYVRSILMTGGDSKAAANVGRGGLALKAGEKVAGVRVTLAEGAAELKGSVEAAPNAKPTGLRVHLIPAERDAADDVPRYFEVGAQSGAFAFTHVAPGRYFVLARAADGEAASAERPRPSAWDAAIRAQLRREAEAANNTVELRPCERVKDFVLRLAASH